MDLFLIRHAQSFNNALEGTDVSSKRVADPPLTEKGRKQAALVAGAVAAGGHLSGDDRADGRRRLDFLYCSAMKRALETASGIGGALDLSPQLWIDVHEVGGIWLEEDGEIADLRGLNRRDLVTQFPRVTIVKDDFAAEGWWPGGLEPEEARDERAEAVAAVLWARAREDSRVGIVSHGGFMSRLVVALSAAHGENSRSAVKGSTHGLYYEHANTAITRMQLGDDGSLTIQYVNRSDHLPLELFSG